MHKYAQLDGTIANQDEILKAVERVLKRQIDPCAQLQWNLAGISRRQWWQRSCDSSCPKLSYARLLQALGIL